MLSQGY